jgi:uncharacterized protein YjbI with pentapeptide repeats
MNITQIEKNLLKFKALNACTECDLLGVDLAGADLSGANLNEAKIIYKFITDIRTTGS